MPQLLDSLLPGPDREIVMASQPEAGEICGLKPVPFKLTHYRTSSLVVQLMEMGV